eukprot:CAMPEP_0114556138 /NCGR_PEP_ID=MMETSP0114-20121206/9133_1 /TAXON_ID=31324 /ORGANISM="Goniomonas sp, Strain m" /LENGTH=199 /DNA_ID=CAMNT_0001741331 /DNA_START=21 /DNA_END=620 /DNA_ORIENTATION=-
MASTKLKVVLLGESSVGKSSIVLRFVQGEFVPNSLPTVGAAFLTQTLHVDGKSIKLEIWDTAGQEKFHGLAPLYYHGAQIALLVYDITEPSSFAKAKYWVSQLQEHGSPDIVICLVGNKVDLEQRRMVQNSDAQDYAHQQDFLFFETSAKLGQNISELFLAAALKAARRTAAKVPDSITLRATGYPTRGEEEPEKKSCC